MTKVDGSAEVLRITGPAGLKVSYLMQQPIDIIAPTASLYFLSASSISPVRPSKGVMRSENWVQFAKCLVRHERAGSPLEPTKVKLTP